jgi:hypothetical protein
LSAGRALAILRAGALYFAAVFAVGFVLGIVRELGAVPVFGRRTAELLESPLMLVAIVLAARSIVRRLAPAATAEVAAVGVVGLGLLLLAELTVVLALRGLTVAEYVKGRDLVAGSVYVLLLLVFATMPAVLASSRPNDGNPTRRER